MSCTQLINYHVPDPTNIGDLLSSPLKYFDFPGFNGHIRDIRSIDSNNVEDTHIIIGGGGLLFERFRSHFDHINGAKTGKQIVWGVGQQRYETATPKPNLFDYKSYISQSHLVSIRDDGMDYPWVPCASCMHPAFDKPRTPKHEYVVFSHKKFQINIPNSPRMTNENTDFETVLDFLGSGHAILTSSFHGAYWGILLGRKVLAFPFSSKFFTLRHKPALYPVNQWQSASRKLSSFGKVLYASKKKEDAYTCETREWKQYLNNAKVYPESLAECRERNHWFYHRVMDSLNE